MKNIYILVILVIFSCSGNEDTSITIIPDNPEPEAQNPPEEVEKELPKVSNVGFDFTAADVEGWELVWEDNFNEGLFEWNIWNGGAFNQELQLYQEQNLFVEDGYLLIEQARENASGFVTPFDPTLKSFEFTSGRIETRDLYNPAMLGTLRIAARIKLPAGEGLWPAFWSYGDPWPTQGEIDILEFRGNRTNEHVTNFFYGTEANTPITDSSFTTYNHDTGIDLTTEFHVYELVWSRNNLIISLDGVEIKNFDNGTYIYIDDMFNKNQKVVLNLAVGGAFFNGTNINNAQIPDQSYLIVDWVKVYKQ
ncbi:family 16 glycosylhydrolase [Maribacter sp. R77961]|uniref:glycoside hydrolase family 16 protein n=1 Tax=Maribacter sp. R77961 TaxID=3093871 RepID=UPI0037CADFBF